MTDKDPLDKIFVETHLKDDVDKPRTLKYFRIVNRKKRNELDLERVVEAKRPYACSDLIEVSTWQNHKSSFWVSIRKYNKTVVLDSGVIESLAEEIKKLKKQVIFK